jgi:nicotinamide-nucleotide amidase
MKSALLFIGSELRYNDPFITYVRRHALEHLGSIENLLFVDEHDKDLFLLLSQIYQQHDRTLIVTTPTSCPTTTKVISTLLDDTLIVEHDMLVPSTATKVVPDSFLVGKEHQINLIKAQPTQSLPPILIVDETPRTRLFAFDSDAEVIKESFAPIAKRCGVEFVITTLAPALVRIDAASKPSGDLDLFAEEIQIAMPANIIVADDIFIHIIDRFQAHEKTITFAESCTGGLLSSMLTSHPGSSTIFLGSIVTYANEVKEAWLGVEQESLDEFGAVSEEVVSQMLSGVLHLTKADYAIAISGIAGPGGATSEKPVGTVVVGCGTQEGKITKTIQLSGDRNYIQHQAALYSLNLLFDAASDILL